METAGKDGHRDGSLAARIVEAPYAPSDGRGADRLQILRTEAARAAPQLASLLDDPEVAHLLRGTFEGSPYLTQLALRDLSRLERILNKPPEIHFSSLTDNLSTELARATGMPE